MLLTRSISHFPWSHRVGIGHRTIASFKLGSVLMNALKVVLGSGILIASNWKSMGKQDGDIVASHLYWQWKCLEDFMVWINLHVDGRYRKVAEKEVRDTEEEEVGAINWNVWPIIIRVKEADRKVWLKRLTHASLIPHLLSIALPVPVQLPVPLFYPLQQRKE